MTTYASAILDHLYITTRVLSSAVQQSSECLIHFMTGSLLNQTLIVDFNVNMIRLFLNKIYNKTT